MTGARDQGECHYNILSLKHKFIPHPQYIQLIKANAQEEAWLQQLREPQR